MLNPHGLGDWQSLVERFLASAEGQSLQAALSAQAQAGQAVYPPDPFRALRLTPRDEVRVVILGQDPYHGPGQAEGLAFSVAPGVRHPPSLRNLFKERLRDLGVPVPRSGSLAHWARQGVLLLNSSLTVQAGVAASHAKLGWTVLTDELIAALARGATPDGPVVFMLWGAHAQAKRGLIASALPEAQATDRCLVLCANHPSPLSALRGPVPFMGCGHFGDARRWLGRRGVPRAAEMFENDSQSEQSLF